MRVELKKQPKKYMSKCPRNDYDKICDALTKLENLEVVQSIDKTLSTGWAGLGWTAGFGFPLGTL